MWSIILDLFLGLYLLGNSSNKGVEIFLTPDIYLSDTLHNWGTIRAGASRRWWLDIENLGSSELTIDSMTFGTDNFYTDVSLPLIVPPSSQTSVPIWFHPDEAITYIDTLLIYSNDPDEPVVHVWLIGEGTEVSYSGGDIIWSFIVTGSVWEHIRSIKSIPDINGDGFDDVVAVSENDTLYLLHGNGDGTTDVLWKRGYGTCYTERGLIIVPDIDGDGLNDIVLGTVWGERKIYAISSFNGEAVWTFDTHMYGGGGWVYEVSSVTDITGDGIPEIIAGAGDDGQGTGPKRVFMLDGSTGELIWDAPLGYAVFGVRAIGDVNGDGYPDIAAGTGDSYPTSFRVYLLDGANGNTIWTINMDDAVWTVIGIGDVNGDDIPDLAAGTMDGKVVALSGLDGSQIWTYYVGGIVTELNILQDADGNGYVELLPAGALISSFMAIDVLTGSPIWTTPAQDAVFSLVATSDIDGDSIPDCIGGTGYSSNYVNLISGSTGEVIWSSPSNTGAVESVFPIEDIEGNGRSDVLVGTREGGIYLLADGGPNLTLEEKSTSIAENFKIYPSPARDFLFIVSPHSMEKLKLDIFDVAGRRVFTSLYNLRGGMLRVDVRHLKPGVYFFKVNDGDKSTTHRIVIVE